MVPLPIDPLIPEVVAAARGRRGMVLVAPPGAGKTTRVPAALLRAGVTAPGHPAVVVLQPRRVAARSVASRIAAENGWELGREVGYHVRFERRIGPGTRLQVVTEGILNRRLLADPFLEGVGAVVLDEFHERSLHTDLAVALLREVRDSVRDDLVIVAMSATLDPGPIAEFLGGLPVLRAEGRTFPVAVEYRPAAREALLDRVADAAAEASSGPGGHVLAFLPGAEEIRRVARRLEAAAGRDGAQVLPLHGNLPADEQDRALRPSDRRKVILATNIAETSLTIDGVTTVVDSGLARRAGFDPARGLDRLELVRISRASADQRAGRAGRTAPGRCIRLWSEREHRGLAESETPEVLRVDLAGTVLALHAWGQPDPARFGWFEPPPAEAMEAAERLLAMLGALEPGGRVTDLGRRMLAIPAHPRQARLLLAAAEAGCPRVGAAMAALLAEKDIVPIEAGPNAPRRDRPDARGRSDLLARLDLLAEAEAARFAPRLRGRVDPAAARRVAQARDELVRVARRGRPGAPSPEDHDPDEDTLLRLALLAYPDRVARRRGPDDATGVMVGGRGVRLAPESVVREAELFLALDPRDDRRGGTREARVRVASAVEPAWLEDLFPDSVTRERGVRIDSSRGRVEGVRTTRYRDLIIREDRHESVSEGDAARALAEALRPEVRAFFEADEAASAWLGRAEFLRRVMPELDLPALDDDDLAGLLEVACRGCRSVAEARKASLVPLLRGLLSYSQARALEDHAPEALAVPSGSRIRLTYESGRPPVLAARVQELFGWADTPRIGGGRVPVLIHLLGPNYRPVQVTDDLRSFWATTYFQVRKDLRARYPKHAWPDDPLTARPEAKGGRRG